MFLFKSFDPKAFFSQPPIMKTEPKNQPVLFWIYILGTMVQ